MMQKLILIAALLLHAVQVFPQQRTGEWEDHLSFANAFRVEAAGQKVFCATAGGIFYRDLEDNSLIKLSRRAGLSDVAIQTFSYNADRGVLVVAYRNSNIDLVYPERVVNLADLQRKLMSGDKTINRISIFGAEAYLSTGFGIVVVNLNRNEIRDTYIIGENGTQLPVFDIETDGNYLYAATASGIYSAPVAGVNLLDYRNWTRDVSHPRSNGKFSHIRRFNGELISVYTRGTWDGDELYALRNGNWQRVLQEVGFVNDLQSGADYLTVTGRSEVRIFSRSFQRVGHIIDYVLESDRITGIDSRSASIGSDGTIWVADFREGLIGITQQAFQRNRPEGPSDNYAFALNFEGNRLWVASGGRTDPWNNQFRSPVFHQFEEGQWKSFDSKAIPELEGFYDIVQVAVHPTDRDHVFVASWGGGLLEFKDGKLLTRHNNLNSPLESALPAQPNEPYTRIGGMAFDGENRLWLTNSQSGKGLHAYSPGKGWESVQLSGFEGFQYTIGQLLVSGRSDKWIVLPRGRDLYVVGKDPSQKRHLPVTSYFNNGQVEIVNRMNDVYSIAEDLNGDIWVGTSKGVAVFGNPSRIWSEDTFYAYQPSLNLGDGNYRPLLETETITSILVDGANRKWLGTKSQGLFLVTERGDRELLHFTAENSPLLSNSITSLAMDSRTARIYIGTDQGLTSYQGDAPVGEKGFEAMYVYPNPVREDYHGSVIITGLMKDSDVRITDVAGNLVHKARSTGNRVEWDGRNFNGRRVSTGVYLVFAADASGENSRMTKLLFIH